MLLDMEILENEFNISIVGVFEKDFRVVRIEVIFKCDLRIVCLSR